MRPTSVSLPIIGAVRIGEKVMKNGRLLPEKLDHFKLTTRTRVKKQTVVDERLVKIFGEKPTKLPIYVLGREAGTSLYSYWAVYNAAGVAIARSEDGLQWTVKTLNRKTGVYEKKYVQLKSEDEIAKKFPQAKLRTIFTFGLDFNRQGAGPNELGGVYVLRVSGFHAYRALWGSLTMLGQMFGDLRKQELTLNLFKQTIKSPKGTDTDIYTPYVTSVMKDLGSAGSVGNLNIKDSVEDLGEEDDDSDDPTNLYEPEEIPDSKPTTKKKRKVKSTDEEPLGDFLTDEDLNKSFKKQTKGNKLTNTDEIPF